MSKNKIVDLFQSLFRVRHTTDKTLYYQIKKNNYEYCDLIDKNIKKDLIKHGNNLINYDKKHNLYIDLKQTEEYILNLVVNEIQEKNLSQNCIEYLIEMFLKKCNYKRDDINDDDDDINDDDDDILNDLIEIKCDENNNYLYEDIKTLSKEEYKLLLEKRKTEGGITDMNKAEIDKYYCLSLFNNDIKEERKKGLFCVYRLDRNKFKFMKYLKKQVNNPEYIQEKLSETDTKRASLIGDFFSKLHLLDQLCYVLEIKHLNQEIDISTEKLNKLEYWLNNNKDNLIKYFKLRIRSKKNDTLTLINHLFKRYSFCKIFKERVRKRVDKKLKTIGHNWKIKQFNKGLEIFNLTPTYIYENIKI